MVTVYGQMRLVTALNVSLHVVNSLLLAAVAGIAICGWLQDVDQRSARSPSPSRW